MLQYTFGVLQSLQYWYFYKFNQPFIVILYDLKKTTTKHPILSKFYKISSLVLKVKNIVQLNSGVYFVFLQWQLLNYCQWSPQIFLSHFVLFQNLSSSPIVNDFGQTRTVHSYKFQKNLLFDQIVYINLKITYTFTWTYIYLGSQDKARPDLGVHVTDPGMNSERHLLGSHRLSTWFPSHLVMMDFYTSRCFLPDSQHFGPGPLLVDVLDHPHR